MVSLLYLSFKLLYNHSNSTPNISHIGYPRQGKNRTCTYCEAASSDLSGIMWSIIIILTFLVSIARFVWLTKPKDDEEKEEEEEEEKENFVTISTNLVKDMSSEGVQGMVEDEINNNSSDLHRENLEMNDNLVEDTTSSGSNNLQRSMKKTNNNMSLTTVIQKIRILIVYVQIISYLDVTFDIPWPDAVRELFQFFTFINIDFEAIFHTLNTCK
jgi:hypothetical protein